jgi:uncharacterized repeat protein (TIGR03803 family)
MKPNDVGTPRPQCKGFRAGKSTKWTIAAITLVLLATTWAAGAEKVLYTFQGGSDGFFPVAGLIFDTHGNAYGTTLIGGGGPCEFGCGTIFKLTPTKTGEWTETIIHHFNPSAGDPGGVVARLTFDQHGNLYGAAGSYLFKLAPGNGGQWTETIIHRFNSCDTDGCDAVGYLLFNRGNLYGTTAGGGGATGCGTVFQLAPQTNGSWRETILHVFHQGVSHCSGHSADGQHPDDGLIMDSTGNLYGTTDAGGPDDQGIVFRLTPTNSGKWTETILHTFVGLEHPTGGANPYGGLVMDKAGNLYGTTVGGGSALLQAGVVFQLTPTQKGPWKETVIHNFPTPRYHDGELPYAGLVIDTAGNLYGSTLDGGGQNESQCNDYDGCGVVYKLSPTASGKWKETILYAFQGGPDGAALQDDRLAIDAAGNLYGTTVGGGANPCNNNMNAGCGVVFEIKP